MYLVSVKKQIKEHTVDLSDLYLKEGSIVLVANVSSKPVILYERKLPENMEFENYPFKFLHDVIIVTRRNGICRIYFNPDNQERQCADIDFKNKKLQKIINEGHYLKLKR